MHLCIVPVSEQTDIEHSTVSGVVKANALVHALDLYDYVSLHGPAIERRHQSDAAQASELKQLAARVERQLMLRRLTRDYTLSAEAFKSGCYRLLRHTKYIVHHTEGSVIRISHRNGIKAGDTVIDVAWNFEM